MCKYTCFFYNIFVRDTPYMETSLVLLGLACPLDSNKVLNPWLWLADHTLVTGPAFCDTEHGPEFYRTINIAANSKSCQNVCKHLYVMKNVQGICSKVKVNGVRPDWLNSKKIIFHPRVEAFKKTTWYFVSMMLFFPVSFSKFKRTISEGRKKYLTV